MLVPVPEMQHLSTISCISCMPWVCWVGAGLGSYPCNHLSSRHGYGWVLPTPSPPVLTLACLQGNTQEGTLLLLTWH